jgi:hypothetical protein
VVLPAETWLMCETLTHAVHATGAVRAHHIADAFMQQCGAVEGAREYAMGKIVSTKRNAGVANAHERALRASARGLKWVDDGGGQSSTRVGSPCGKSLLVAVHVPRVHGPPAVQRPSKPSPRSQARAIGSKSSVRNGTTSESFAGHSVFGSLFRNAVH